MNKGKELGAKLMKALDYMSQVESLHLYCISMGKSRDNMLTT